MNKADLISFIAYQAELSTSEARRALDAVTAGITQALQKGDTVLINGFGSFSVSESQAREDVARTAQQITAPKHVVFTQAKGLKQSLN